MELAISIAGVIVAFLVGLFADPLKTYFANRNEREQLRKALYKEMAFMFEHLFVMILGDTNSLNLENYGKMLLTLTRFETYDYAKTRPILFYQLRDALEINHMYTLFSICFDTSLFTSVDGHKEGINKLMISLETSLLNGELDMGLFLKSSTPRVRQMLKDTIKRLKNSPDSGQVLKNSAS